MIFAPKKKVKPNTWIFFSCKTCLKNKKRPVDPWIYTSVSQAVDLQFFSFPLISFKVPVCNSKRGAGKTLQLSTTILSRGSWFCCSPSQPWPPMTAEAKSTEPNKMWPICTSATGRGGHEFQRLCNTTKKPKKCWAGKIFWSWRENDSWPYFGGLFWATWNNSSSWNQ